MGIQTNKQQQNQTIEKRTKYDERKIYFFGVRTSSYLSAGEARLKLFASMVNLARACIISRSMLLIILENCKLAGRRSSLDKARSVISK